MNSDNSLELFPLVDTEGNVIGRATRGECHGGSMLLHPVVHLHLFDADGRLRSEERRVGKECRL